MFHSTNDTSANPSPLNLSVQVFIDQSTDGNILPSYQIEAMTNFDAGFWVIGRSDDALDSLAKDEVCELVTRKEVPRQRSPVGRDYENLFCGGALSVTNTLALQMLKGHLLLTYGCKDIRLIA